MTVTVSEKWQRLENGDWEPMWGEMARTVLLKWCETYQVKAFAKPFWDTNLYSASYKRRKIQLGRKGIADMLLTGTLYEAATVDAAKTITVEGSVATTYVSTPYAARLYYGGDGLVPRPFADISRYKKQLTTFLKGELKSILKDMTPNATG